MKKRGNQQNWSLNEGRQYKVSSRSHLQAETSDALHQNPRQRDPSASASSNKDQSRTYEFITSSNPEVNRDPEVRKLVRKHVVKDTQESKVKQLKNDIENFERETRPPMENVHSQSQICSSSFVSGARTPVTLDISKQIEWHFLAFPIKMKPHLHRLVTLYFNRLVSKLYRLEDYLEFNPLKTSALFEFTMTDDAVFHSLLYAAAVASSLIDGIKGSEEVALQLSETAAIVSKRLRSIGPHITHGTIYAVTCLVMGEVGHT